jgi:predicted class III extradiol MEMO1 family dioxygenase
MKYESSNFDGINAEALYRYVAMRKKVDEEAKTAHSLSSMLALVQHCGDDKLEVDPVALGHVNELIGGCILNIWEYLDDFIYLVQAKSNLEKLDNNKV